MSKLLSDLTQTTSRFVNPFWLTTFHGRVTVPSNMFIFIF